MNARVTAEKEPTYSADWLAFQRRQLASAIATRQEIEFSDAFDSLERAMMLKKAERVIAALEKRITDWSRLDSKRGEVIR